MLPVAVPLFAMLQSADFTLVSTLTCGADASPSFFGGKKYTKAAHKPAMTTTAPPPSQESVFWFSGFARNDHKEAHAAIPPAA